VTVFGQRPSTPPFRLNALKGHWGASTPSSAWKKNVMGRGNFASAQTFEEKKKKGAHAICPMKEGTLTGDQKAVAGKKDLEPTDEKQPPPHGKTSQGKPISALRGKISTPKMKSLKKKGTRERLKRRKGARKAKKKKLLLREDWREKILKEWRWKKKSWKRKIPKRSVHKKISHGVEKKEPLERIWQGKNEKQRR